MSILSSILAACAGERPDNLGVRNGRLADCPGSPNCVSSQDVDEGHRIAPLVFSDEPDPAFTRLQQLLGSRGDTTIIAL
jgi:uncharacterized protein (DUF1499 family)